MRNEKKKWYDRFAVIIFSLNLILGGLLISQSTATMLYRHIPAFILFFAGMISGFIFFLRKVLQKKPVLFVVASIFVTVHWLLTGYPGIAVIMAALFLLYLVSVRELKVIVGENKIIYPSFPKKDFEWNELRNIIYKDGLLTIDLKSNHIIQQYADESKTSVDEKDFNEFCRNRLHTASFPDGGSAKPRG